MATIKKKPTKAHKSKKVIKAHQGMAHVPRPKQRPTAPIIAQPTDVLRPTKSVVDTSKSRPTKAINLSNPTTRKNYTDTLTKDLIANNPFNKSTRRPTPSPIKTVYDAPMPTTTTDTRKPMDERARRRRDNAFKSELDEAMRQASKRPRRPRQPTAQPIRQPTPLGQPMRLPKDFGGRKPRPIQPRQQPPLIGTPISFPQRAMSLPRQPNKTKPFSLGPLPENFTMNKGGAVKKKYSEVKTLKQGGYVSRAKYGSVDNLKKKK